METHSPLLHSPESFDVVIVGAGISGIDAAYRLQTECPDKSYTVPHGRYAAISLPASCAALYAIWIDPWVSKFALAAYPPNRSGRQ